MRSTILGRRKTLVLLHLQQQDFPSDLVDFIVLLKPQELETLLVMQSTLTSELLVLVLDIIYLSSPLWVTLLRLEVTPTSLEQEIGLVLAIYPLYLEERNPLHSYLPRMIEHSSTLKVNWLRSLVRVITTELDHSSDLILLQYQLSSVLLMMDSSPFMVKSLKNQSSPKLDLDLLELLLVQQKELPSITIKILPSAHVRVMIMDSLMNRYLMLKNLQHCLDISTILSVLLLMMLSLSLEEYQTRLIMDM